MATACWRRMQTTVYQPVSCIRTRTAVIGGFFMPSSRRNFVRIFTLLCGFNRYAMLRDGKGNGHTHWPHMRVCAVRKVCPCPIPETQLNTRRLLPTLHASRVMRQRMQCGLFYILKGETMRERRGQTKRQASVKSYQLTHASLRRTNRRPTIR